MSGLSARYYEAIRERERKRDERANWVDMVRREAAQHNTLQPYMPVALIRRASTAPLPADAEPMRLRGQAQARLPGCR